MQYKPKWEVIDQEKQRKTNHDQERENAKQTIFFWSKTPWDIPELWMYISPTITSLYTSTIIGLARKKEEHLTLYSITFPTALQSSYPSTARSYPSTVYVVRQVMLLRREMRKHSCLVTSIPRHLLFRGRRNSSTERDVHRSVRLTWPFFFPN